MKYVKMKYVKMQYIKKLNTILLYNTIANIYNKMSSSDQSSLISLYIEQLTEQQKVVLNIAKDHLATSFCIEKSIGYLKWRGTARGAAPLKHGDTPLAPNGTQLAPNAAK